MTTPDIIRAHRHSSFHRDEVLTSKSCGCFYCLQEFPPSKIIEWIDNRANGGNTALCPYCRIDSVIGEESGYPLTKEFLQEMREYWFDREIPAPK